MKVLINLITILGMLSCSVSSLAAKGGVKGPDAAAYKHANENASFKRGGDWGKEIDNKDLNKIDKAIKKENKQRDKKDAKYGETKDINKAVKKAKKAIK